MTSKVPWPIVYASFVIAIIAIGIMTFLALNAAEKRKLKTKSVMIKQIYIISEN
jgi:hypothetical protein